MNAIPWGAVPITGLGKSPPVLENPLRINREQLQTIRNRYRGYRITLVYELLFLLLLPLAQLFNQLPSLLLIGYAVVLMVFVIRFSRVPRAKPLMFLLGGTAIGLELIWRGALAWQPALGRMITLPLVVVWLLFLLAVVVRGIRSLIREPFVTMSVLQGAAGGYLTLGIAGGVMLNCLWVLQPSAFVGTALPAPISNGGPSGHIAAALMNASFGLLTTIGTDVLDAKNVTVHALATMITLSGQLYIAILIGMILGRVHKRIA